MNPNIDEAADLIASSAGLTGYDRMAAKNAILLLAKIAARETRYAAVDIVNDNARRDDTETAGRIAALIQNLPFATETREAPESFCFDLRKRVGYRLLDMSTPLPLYVTVMITAGESPASLLEKASALIYDKHKRYIDEWVLRYDLTPVRFDG